MEQVAKKAKQDLERLKTHRAKLEAFFEECGTVISSLVEPLEDCQLFVELGELEAEVDDLHVMVKEVIMTTTARVVDGIGGLQEQFSNLGVSAALPVTDGNNFLQDYAQLESLVTRIVELEVPSFEDVEVASPVDTEVEAEVLS